MDASLGRESDKELDEESGMGWDKVSAKPSESLLEKVSDKVLEMELVNPSENPSDKVWDTESEIRLVLLSEIRMAQALLALVLLRGCTALLVRVPLS